MTTSILKNHKQDVATNALERIAVFIETTPDRLLKTLYSWQTRISDRRHLRELDERMLVDIGLDRVDIEREAGKPFWQN
ncbi:MAG: DUF1127 domain-containing protein [Rhodospirillaceae bacterium]|nr:DUF1127 domain-containing protein [Rhodospirillaceae bacterium]